MDDNNLEDIRFDEEEDLGDLIVGPDIFNEYRGAIIEHEFPDSLNFISGAAFFDVHLGDSNNRVADNIEFRGLVNRYFQGRLQDPEFVRSLFVRGNIAYRVVGEIDDILEMALNTPLPRLGGALPTQVRIWKKARPGPALREATWKNFLFRDVTMDRRVLKEALSPPLKTSLRTLYPPPRPPQPVRSDVPSEANVAAGAAAIEPQQGAYPMRQLNVNEETLVQDTCRRINDNGVYVASLFTLHNDRDVTPANAYVADRVAEQWTDEEDSPPRFIYRFDASDSGTLTESYMKQLRNIHLEHGTSEYERPRQRARLVPQVAANGFLKTFRNLFPPDYECLFIYTNVPHPVVFTDGFLPRMWERDLPRQSQQKGFRVALRGVLLCTAHPEYNSSIGPPYGNNMEQISLEWRTSDMDEGYWWDRLPDSRLPCLLVNVPEPCGLEKRLLDGRATALVDIGQASAIDAANQVARRWESEGQGRFSLWLDATDDSRLRTAYQLAIRQVTFTSPNQPVGNATDLPTQSIADTLMAYLSKKRELSARDHRFTMVFANAPPGEDLHHKFFSARSNWWNAHGRFFVTTVATAGSFQVELEANGMPMLVPLPAIPCASRSEGEEEGQPLVGV